MSPKLFPFLATIGSLSGVSDVNPRPRAKRAVVRDDLADVFSTFPQQTYESFKKIYPKVKCVPKELRSLSFESVSSNIYLVQPNKELEQTEEVFPNSSRSCLSIFWDRKTGDKRIKWSGEWNLFWFVTDGTRVDIFFNRVYTEKGNLYSEGLSYKFKKEEGEWVGKERIQSWKRQVTESNKKHLIIKPEEGQVDYMQGEYGGFGDFNLENICSNEKCKKLRNKEIVRKHWVLVSSKTDSSLYSWFNYSNWRDPSKGLFPSNRIDRNYYRTPRSTPPSNDISRYSGIKGLFKLKKMRMDYQGSGFKTKAIKSLS